jgi:cardiolipin synthase
MENNDANKSATQFIYGYPDCKYDNINISVLSMINNAKKSIIIVNPFFLPTNEIVQALKIAAHNGVKIKIILPHRNSDRNYALLINRYLYSE